MRLKRIGAVVALASTAAVLAAGVSWASGSTVVRSVPLSGGAISSDGTHVWMLVGSGTLEEFSAANGTVVRVIHGLPGDSDAVSSDGTHVWVVGEDGALAEIDAATGAVVGTIQLPVGSHYAVSSDGTHVWVPNSPFGTVTDVDAASDTIVGTFPVETPIVGLRGALVAVSSDGSHVWVADMWGGTFELDATTGQVVGTAETGFLADGASAISADGTHVWVVDEPAGADSEQFAVTEIDAATGGVVRTIPEPRGVREDGWSAVSSDGAHAWVADSGAGTVTEIDARTGRIVATIHVGNEPTTVSSDGTHVWVAGNAGLREIQIAPRVHPLVGIGDDKPDLFRDPRFLALGIANVRYDMPWDALSVARERARVTRWMDDAKADHVSVLVTFDHSDRVLTERVHGKTKRVSKARELPSATQYLKAFEQFRERFPWVTQFATWDESNFYGEPTYDAEARVAGYYRALRSACRSCTILAAELLDAPRGDAVPLTTWTHRFIAALGAQPSHWGLDNFEDANHLATANTRRMLAAVRGDIWLDETAGIVRRHNGAQHPGFPENANHAARADRFLLDTIGSLSPRIQRIYLYEWDAHSARDGWDSALISYTGASRPGYDVLAETLDAWGLKPDCLIASAPPSCS